MTSANGGDFDLTMDELRAVVRFATDCAESLLPDFEAEAPEDSRPREALNAARAFAEGATRTNLQRKAAFAAHRAAQSVSAETAQLAALACGDAAASAYLHPIAQATQVGHILRAAACAARVAELRAGDDGTTGSDSVSILAERATSPVPDVLRRYPAAPQGRSRLSQLMSALDTAIRHGHADLRTGTARRNHAPRT
ncbi:putative immunity protein [Sanguibacter sp. 25GB23B1]|uniref:putative immunity protein n=1 Tax=unclassified Sanguibacter TaxID=2645534 RepID=UPI0032AFCF43